MVAVALWALAGGLFLGRTIAADIDRGVGIGMDWLAMRGPSFLRPYLPAPVPKLIEPRARLHVAASPPPAAAAPSKEGAHAAPKHDRSQRHR